MEVAALRLLDMLQSRSLKVIVLSGPPPTDVGAAEIEALNLPHMAYRLPLAAARLHRTFRALPPHSTIVAVGLWAAIPTLMAAKRHRVIVWEHSLLPDRVSRDSRVRVLRRLAAHYYRHAHAVVAVSEPVREYVVGFLEGTTVLCIPNLLEPVEVPAPRAARRGTRLAVVGKLHAAKNVGLAIRAMGHLPRDVDLRIAGEGSDRRALEREAKRCGVEDRVHFLGRIDDVGELLQTADVLVHPAWAETFGYVLLEAAQRRTPVVALNRPNMSSLIPHVVPGVVVDEPTAIALADAISDALARDWPDTAFDRAAELREHDYDPRSIRRTWETVLDGWAA
jgi:glycosyltransferase involved in cell wall biosynthesis